MSTLFNVSHRWYRRPWHRTRPFNTYEEPIPQETTMPQEEITTDQPSTSAGSFNIPTDLQSTTGPNWQGPIGQAILPDLQQSIGRLPQLASQFAPSLQGMYSNLMREGMGPQAFQGTLNNLASRGILNSSVASDALSRAGTNIARNIGNQAYPSFIQGLQQQMDLPSTLGSLASMETARSDPMRAYELLARMLMY